MEIGSICYVGYGKIVKLNFLTTVSLKMFKMEVCQKAEQDSDSLFFSRCFIKQDANQNLFGPQ